MALICDPINVFVESAHGRAGGFGLFRFDGPQSYVATIERVYFRSGIIVARDCKLNILCAHPNTNKYK